MAEFVEFDGSIHIINPAQAEFTLCGDAYDISAVDDTLGEFQETKARTVTCDKCKAIILGCRGVRVSA